MNVEDPIERKEERITSTSLFVKLRNGAITFLLLEEKLDDVILEGARYNTCKNCPFYNPDNDKCTDCGCYMSVKTGMLKNKNIKTMLVEITGCPLGIWPTNEDSSDIEIANLYRREQNLPELTVELQDSILKEAQLRKSLGMKPKNISYFLT